MVFPALGGNPNPPRQRLCKVCQITTLIPQSGPTTPSKVSCELISVSLFVSASPMRLI